MLLYETNARKYKYDADLSYIALLNQPNLVLVLGGMLAGFTREVFSGHAGKIIWPPKLKQLNTSLARLWGRLRPAQAGFILFFLQGVSLFWVSH